MACGTTVPVETSSPPPAEPVAPPLPVAPAPPPGRPIAASDPKTVADAMVLGDCATVLRLIREPSGPGEAATATRLAIATCQLRTGHADLARSVLEGDDTTALAPHRRLLRARVAAELGDVDAALQDLDGLVLPGGGGRAVQLLRGRLRAERGDPEAKRDLEALFPSDDGPEAQFRLADLLARTHDAAGERTRLQELWVDTRPGGWDERAAERLAALGSPVPDLATPAGIALARRRLEALNSRARATEAKELADRLVAVEKPSDRDGWVLLGKVRYAARDYASTLVAWREAYGAPAAAEGSATELFDYALCHARADDYDTAGIVYRRVFEKYPTTKEADFASFKLGYMQYDRGNCTEAVSAFAEHRARYPDSKHLDEALWFGARCAWKAGDRAAASAAWAELETSRPKSSLVAGAAYWRARALGLDGNAAGERSGLEAVLNGWPTSGYAFLAAERLGRTFPVKPAAPLPAWPAALAPQPGVVAAEALLTVGLRDPARDALAEIPDPTDRAAQLALGWAHLRAGNVVAAKRIGCKLAESPWKSGDPAAQQLCTPRPEPFVVQQYTVGIDPSIVYGVMVAESALDPAVSSAVGARGLMQLMPAVAETLHARVFPGQPFSSDDLFSAPYNAALGATELSDRAVDLADALDPSGVPAVVASYNGGVEAVERWIGDAEHPPSDEWTEDIGYVETRGYVKRVLGFAMAYRWVYGDRP